MQLTELKNNTVTPILILILTTHTLKNVSKKSELAMSTSQFRSSCSLNWTFSSNNWLPMRKQAEDSVRFQFTGYFWFK